MASPPASRPARGRIAYALLFLALFVPFSYFNHSDGWNQGVRLAELHAIVAQGHAAHRRLSRAHRRQGAHRRPLLQREGAGDGGGGAAGVCADRLGAEDARASIRTRRGWRVSEWIATAGSVGLLAALGGVAFFALLTPRFDAADRGAGDVRPVPRLDDVALRDVAVRARRHDRPAGIALWAALSRPIAAPRLPRRPRRRVRGGVGVSRRHSVRGDRPLSRAHADLPRECGDSASATLPARAADPAQQLPDHGLAVSSELRIESAFPEITSGNSLWASTCPIRRRCAALLWGEYRGLFFWCPVLLMAIAGLVELFRKDRAIAHG